MLQSVLKDYISNTNYKPIIVLNYLTEMTKERSPSLFLPVLAAVLFLLVVLTGITEVVCLASYASKHNQQSKLTNKTQSQSPALIDGNAQKVMSSVSVADALPK